MLGAAPEGRRHDTTSSKVSAYLLSQHLLPVVNVRISELLLDESPRHQGVDPAHVHVLEESGEPLPPILVHSGIMRVIDGMHRVRVAVAQGAQTIEARLFEGSREEAYVLAVQLNTRHGLPLSLSERRAAALHIMTVYPAWSDRAVATTTGLSAKTVAKIRRSRSTSTAGTDVRIGKDGRLRPVDRAAGRLRATQLIAARPDASLREIARAAGISPNTARTVRRQMSDGRNLCRPVEALEAAQLPYRRETDRGQTERASAAPSCPPVTGRQLAWASLTRDPALRSSDAGRLLLRGLSVQALDGKTWDKLVRAIPPHCTQHVADLARRCAEVWEELAARLDASIDEAAPSSRRSACK